MILEGAIIGADCLACFAGCLHVERETLEAFIKAHQKMTCELRYRCRLIQPPEMKGREIYMQIGQK